MTSYWKVLSLEDAVHSLHEAYLPQISLENIFNILRRCMKEKVRIHALQVNCYMHGLGLESLELLGNYLVSLLVEVGCINDAQLVFNRLQVPDEFSWNALVIGSLKYGNSQNAFAVYERMQELSTIILSEPAFVLLLKACTEELYLEKGYELHATAAMLGFLESNLFIGSTVVDMYTKLGLVVEAEQVFLNLPNRDVVSWTAMIAGYVENRLWEEALTCFEKMQYEGVFPNAVTYICGIRACGSIGNLVKGREFHAEAGRLGILERHLSVGSTLVDMYAKCGLLEIAQEVFDRLLVNDVVSWTTLISGYAEHGYGENALQLAEQMQVGGIFPTAVTLVCSLKACQSIRAINKVQQLHVEAERQGLLIQNDLVASTLVSTYMKCGLLDRAQQVFDKLLVRDSSSWTAVIMGYTENGYFEKAHKLFDQMASEGLSPDSTAIVCCMKACQKIGAVEKVGALLAKIEQLGLLEKDEDIGSTLVDAYLKCGSVAIALQMFDKLLVRDVVAWTSLIAGLLENGSSEQASQYLEQIQQEGVLPNVVTLIAGLKACSISKAIKRGQTIHARIEIQGLVENHRVIGNTLVDLYAKCGLMGIAEQVFDRLPEPDVISWTTLIAGYVEHRHGEQALLCLEQLQSNGVIPNAVTLMCGLKACSSVGAMYEGQELHAEIERQGLLESDAMIGSTLIEMYVKLGWLAKGCELFCRLPVRNVISWNALIAGCVEEGHCNNVFEYYAEMKLEGVFPNAATFVSCLKACSISGLIDKGEDFHAEIERLALLERDPFVDSALVDMYIKCGSLVKAEQVFNKLSSRDLVSWTAITAGYVAYGFSQKALQGFEQMQVEGLLPNALTSNCTLKACSSIKAINKGREIHVKVNSWVSPDRDLVGGTLVQMYIDCGFLPAAKQVFDTLPVQDTFLLEALIAGYIKPGGFEDALTSFEKMNSGCGFPDATTLLCSLAAFTSSGAADKVQYVHAEIEKQRLVEHSPVSGNIMVDLYSRCGLVEKAQRVFDKLLFRDVCSWNALLAGYADSGHSEKAIRCFEQMREEHVYPDVTTLMCVIKACIDVGATRRVQDFLAEINIKALLRNELFAGTGLVDLCVKCGSLPMAQEIFDMLPFHDSIMWTSLIAGYTEYEYADEALECLEKMQCEETLSTAAALVCLLKACGSIGAIDKGRQIHKEIEARGLVDRDLVGNSLLSMYMKCGSLVEAQKIFDQLPSRDVVSWTILMTGYGNLGESEDVFHIFDVMLGAAIQPDPVSFLVVLNACSRKGLFTKSEMYIEAMSRVHGVTPGLKHYTCIIDLLGRAGHIGIAVAQMNMIPVSPNLVTWHTVLNACIGGGNVELGEQVFDQTLCLDKHYAFDGSFLCKWWAF